MSLYSHTARPAFKIGDRVETALHGRATVKYFWRDRNIGWTYRIFLDAGIAPFGRDIRLVETALTPVPAVDQLAELAR